jgi:hypothetical protein
MKRKRKAKERRWLLPSLQRPMEKRPGRWRASLRRRPRSGRTSLRSLWSTVPTSYARSTRKCSTPRSPSWKASFVCLTTSMFMLMLGAEEIAKAKPNLNVLSEYRRREAEFLDRAKDMESVTTARDAAKQRYDDLRKVRLDEFMAGSRRCTR